MALSGEQLLQRVRKFIDDNVVPYLHSDEELYQYLTEAERELALNGRLLRRTLTLSTIAEESWVTLPDAPEIIEFRRAEVVDGSHRYPLRLQGTMDTFQSTISDYGQVFGVSSSTRGRPHILVFGRYTDRIELLPTPDKIFQIEASVLVYPEEPIVSYTTQVTIPVRHEAAVPIGAALRAIEADPFFDHNSNKLQTLANAWQQALIRAAQETGAISREASPVQFSNEYW